MTERTEQHDLDRARRPRQKAHQLLQVTVGGSRYRIRVIDQHHQRAAAPGLHCSHQGRRIPLFRRLDTRSPAERRLQDHR